MMDLCTAGFLWLLLQRPVTVTTAADGSAMKQFDNPIVRQITASEGDCKKALTQLGPQAGAELSCEAVACKK
jgi:hypothetical protein